MRFNSKSHFKTQKIFDTIVLMQIAKGYQPIALIKRIK